MVLDFLKDWRERQNMSAGNEGGKQIETAGKSFRHEIKVAD